MAWAAGASLLAVVACQPAGFVGGLAYSPTVLQPTSTPVPVRPAAHGSPAASQGPASLPTASPALAASPFPLPSPAVTAGLPSPLASEPPLSSHHQQLLPGLTTALVAIARIHYLQVRATLERDEGGSPSSVGHVATDITSLPGGVAPSPASSAAAYHLAAAPPVINIGRGPNEQIYANRRWTDGVKTLQFTSDAAHPEDAMRTVDLDVAGRTYRETSRTVQARFADGAAQAVALAGLTLNDDGSPRAAYQYQVTNDTSGRVASVSFQQGSYHEPASGLGLEVRALTLDAGGGVSLQYAFDGGGGSASGTAAGGAIDADGRFGFPVLDPLAVLDGDVGVDDDAGHRLFEVRRMASAGQHMLAYQLDGGLALQYPTDVGDSLHGQLLDARGNSLATACQETLPDGTTTTSLTFPEAPTSPVVLGFGHPGGTGEAPPAATVTVTTLAGANEAGYRDDDGTGARFGTLGNIVHSPLHPERWFVADTGNHRVRTLTFVNGHAMVGTLAGDGVAGHVDARGTAARFFAPYGLAVGPDETVYVAERGGNCVRAIAPDGSVTTLAGTGQPGTADGPGARASFNGPTGLALDTSGNLYVADTGNHRIRVVSPAGQVSTLSGAQAGFAEGTSARYNSPLGLAMTAGGDLLVADTGNRRVRRLSLAQGASTLAGSGDPTAAFTDGPAALAALGPASALAVDSLGQVYVAALDIRVITPVGVVQTVAGRTRPGLDDGNAREAGFGQLAGIGVETDGSLIVADGTRLRRIQGLAASSP